MTNCLLHVDYHYYDLKTSMQEPKSNLVLALFSTIRFSTLESIVSGICQELSSCWDGRPFGLTRHKSKSRNCCSLCLGVEEDRKPKTTAGVHKHW